MPNWGPRPLRSKPGYERTPEQTSFIRGRDIVRKWAEGMEYLDIAEFHGMTVKGVREILPQYLKGLWHARYKWRMAEMRCRAMALELRCLRVGLECPEDQPLETLNPSEKSLKIFKRAGVHTVNQLRSVDGVVLANSDHFRRSALVWAILKLDELGLSHRLRVVNDRARYARGAQHFVQKENLDAAGDHNQDDAAQAQSDGGSAGVPGDLSVRGGA